MGSALGLEMHLSSCMKPPRCGHQRAHDSHRRACHSHDETQPRSSCGTGARVHPSECLVLRQRQTSPGEIVCPLAQQRVLKTVPEGSPHTCLPGGSLLVKGTFTQTISSHSSATSQCLRLQVIDVRGNSRGLGV